MNSATVFSASATASSSESFTITRSNCGAWAISCSALATRFSIVSAETIEKRVAKAEQEIAHAPQFDRVIVNDSLEEAVAEAEKTVAEFIG